MRLLNKIGLLAMISLCGCANYNVQQSGTTSKTLQASYPVYVVLSAENYLQQNQQVQAAFEKALSKRGVSVFAGETRLRESAAFALAQRLKLGYVLYPEVTKWEDHNTPWSTIRDKVNISVKVIEMGSGRLISQNVLEGKSTFWTMKNTAPDVIFPGLVSQYVGTLYE